MLVRGPEICSAQHMKRETHPSCFYKDTLARNPKPESAKEADDTIYACKFSNAVLLKPYIQSTLVISKSKGPSKTVRDIRTSTYQICSIEEKNN